MKLKGAIFDLDGTLLDSMGMWYTIGDEYLMARGCTPEPGLWEKLKTLSMLQTAVYFKEEYGLQDCEEEVISQVNAMIEYKYAREVQFKPSALDFIKKLDRLGIKMCVATATDRHLVEAALKRLGSMEYFCGILTCTEVGCGKDRPLIYERALELLNTKKEETIVFEDALHAVETAKKAGFLVAGIQEAGAEEDREQIKRTADWYLTSFDELELNRL